MPENDAELLSGEPKRGKKPAETKSDENITISVSALEAMFDRFSKTIAEAMVKSREPWIDPRAKENDDAMRKSMREVKERIDEQIKASQSVCPHYQGSNELSEFQGSLSSIAKHRLDDGTIIGICTNCLRQFWPGDSDYVTQLNRKSGNRMSQAGQRQFLRTPASLTR